MSNSINLMCFICFPLTNLYFIHEISKSSIHSPPCPVIQKEKPKLVKKNGGIDSPKFLQNMLKVEKCFKFVIPSKKTLSE